VNNSRNLRLHRWEALIRFASVFSLHVFLRAVIIVLFAGMMAGCLPSSQSALDEQNEMHFRKGKALVSALDYTGATESFERALEANPKNSSAHFELGLLYEREGDYSAAIYHFERFLKLRPESEHADIVRSRINTDKMELSKSTLLAPVTQNMQREFEKLAEENKQLRAQLEQARAEVEQWRVHYASQPQSTARTAAPAPQQTTAANPQPTVPYTATSRPLMRTHTIKPGDTLTSVASRYGVKLDAITSVNPGLDPRRLRVGQVINVPPN
jgi:LysM repeat protein